MIVNVFAIFIAKIKKRNAYAELDVRRNKWYISSLRYTVIGVPFNNF